LDNSGIFLLPLGDPQSIADWSMSLSDTAGDKHPTINQPIDDPRILKAQKEPDAPELQPELHLRNLVPQFNVAQNGKVDQTPVEAINGQTPGDPAVYKSPVTGQTIVVGDKEQNQFVHLIDQSVGPDQASAKRRRRAAAQRSWTLPKSGLRIGSLESVELEGVQSQDAVRVLEVLQRNLASPRRNLSQVRPPACRPQTNRRERMSTMSAQPFRNGGKGLTHDALAQSAHGRAMREYFWGHRRPHTVLSDAV
jgi:hypothetical protein